MGIWGFGLGHWVYVSSHMTHDLVEATQLNLCTGDTRRLRFMDASSHNSDHGHGLGPWDHSSNRA